MNVSQIFETMDYGKAPEASDEAMKWIASFKGRFGHFINGTFTKTEGLFPSVNPATTQELAKNQPGIQKNCFLSRESCACSATQLGFARRTRKS